MKRIWLPDIRLVNISSNFSFWATVNQFFQSPVSPVEKTNITDRKMFRHRDRRLVFLLLLIIKVHMEKKKTEVLKRVATEAKDRQWKSFCDTLNRDTTLTHFWQFYRQMEGSAASTNTPDLIDASGAVLKTSKEKGSALLQRFVQQSNQNNLDERKAVWKGLDRTVTEAGSNDDLITELEFIEALSGLSKDTAPGPDKVKILRR